MYQSEIKLRVRYAETDRMSYVYYGKYAEYFEVARVETLRKLGITYREIEDKGILLPVLDYRVRFLKPAFYDEWLFIKTTIPAMPSARIVFSYETFNESKTKINEAETTLVFIRKADGRPCRAPAELTTALSSFFSVR